MTTLALPTRLLLLLLTGLLGFSLTSCGGQSEAEVDTSIAAVEDVASAIEEGAVVIDVRTPAEFATGHLAHALNVDVSSDDFEEKVAGLDKGVTYVLYCRTGSRAAEAVETMAGLGFEKVLNGGGYTDLEEAGVEVS